jgi:hypothetical protein
VCLAITMLHRQIFLGSLKHSPPNRLQLTARHC